MNWQQLRAIVWVRWRLSRNQFARAGKVNAALSIAMSALLLMAAVGCGAGGVAGGALGLAPARPQMLLLVWDGVVAAFLFIWLTGFLVEIQRAESIDLGKLLHLPVTLPQVFVFNYAAAHATPVLLLFLPGMLGLCAGLVLGAGPAMLLLVPLVLGFVFVVTAWTYCLRGWLTALMINPRRRRAIVVWVTVVFILACQVPNLVFNSPWLHAGHGTGDEPPAGAPAAAAGESPRGLVPEAVVQAHLAVPPGWVGYGAMGLRQGERWPALGFAAVCGLIGAWGLLRAYRQTLRFYQGADDTAGRAARAQVPLPPRGTLLVERRLPGLAEEAAALTVATFRSLSRSPQVKMVFVMPVVLGALFLTAPLSRIQAAASGGWAPFVATAAAVFATFSTLPINSNVFGIDGDGFRALVLLPARRDHILLAKNLASFPFTALLALGLLILARFSVRLPWGDLFPALVQVPAAFLLFSLACNFISLLAPFRLAPHSFQARKPKPIVIVATLVFLLLLPIVLSPLLVPPLLQWLCVRLGWAPGPPVNLLATLALLAAVIGLYRTVLPYQGRLLQAREQRILREVTEETE